MRCSREHPCCDQVSKTGVLQCSVDPAGQEVEGHSRDLALLFRLADGTPMLAWRRSEGDRWNYSHARRLFVASDSDPLASKAFVGVLGFAPPHLRSYDLGRRDGNGLWVVELPESARLDPRLLALDSAAGVNTYPVAILSSLGFAVGKESADANPDWAWARVNAAAGRAGDRQVRVAILDNGYFRHDFYNRIVEADRRQDIIGAGSLENTEDSHGTACLLYAAEVVMRSQGGAEVVTLLPYRIFHDISCTTEDIITWAIDDILENRIDIVVAPWFIAQENSRLEQEIGRLERRGILFLTAPANDPLDLDECACAQQMASWSPRNIGVVGAVAPDADRWPYCWGHERIDVGAPGESLHNRLTGTGFDSGASFSVSIAAGMVAVELSSNRHTNAIAAWHHLADQSRVDPCKDSHQACEHCVSEGVIHFR